MKIYETPVSLNTGLCNKEEFDRKFYKQKRESPKTEKEIPMTLQNNKNLKM